MARPKGYAKSGGRKKGTPNKRTLLLAEILEVYGIDVPRRLARLIKKGALTDRDRVHVLLELMGYLYPKRKALEVTGREGGPLEVYLRMAPEERARRRLELEKRLTKG